MVNDGLCMLQASRWAILGNERSSETHCKWRFFFRLAGKGIGSNIQFTGSWVHLPLIYNFPITSSTRSTSHSRDISNHLLSPYKKPSLSIMLHPQLYLRPRTGTFFSQALPHSPIEPNPGVYPPYILTLPRASVGDCNSTAASMALVNNTPSTLFVTAAAYAFHNNNNNPTTPNSLPT